MSSNKRPRLSESEDSEGVSETEEQQTTQGKAAQYVGESDFEGLGEEDEDEASDDEQAALQQELSSLPFSTLIQAKAALPPPSKKRKRPSITEEEKASALAALEPLKGRRKGRTEPRHGVLPQELAKPAEKPKKERKELAKRSSKHAPMEMSSKRSVTRHRQVVDVAKIDRRDPRFDPTLSSSSYTTPSTSYSFLSESKQNELVSLRAQVAASKKNANMSNSDKEFLQRELTVLESKHAREVREQKEKDVMKEWKKTEREKRKEGKGEFYLKRGEAKKLVESKRKEELAKDPKREKKVEMRKEKKAAGKEKKRKPPSRPV